MGYDGLLKVSIAKRGGTLNWLVYNEKPSMDDLGYPYFRKPPYERRVEGYKMGISGTWEIIEAIICQMPVQVPQEAPKLSRFLLRDDTDHTKTRINITKLLVKTIH